MTNCEICKEKIYKYKCPQCFVKYCSVQCFKAHKGTSCTKTKENIHQSSEETVNKNISVDIDYADEEDAEDRVPMTSLDKLGEDSGLKQLLQNPHLRQIIKHLDTSTDPQSDMEKAMQEPIFVEFADACLHIVEPEKET